MAGAAHNLGYFLPGRFIMGHQKSTSTIVTTEQIGGKSDDDMAMAE